MRVRSSYTNRKKKTFWKIKVSNNVRNAKMQELCLFSHLLLIILPEGSMNQKKYHYLRTDAKNQRRREVTHAVHLKNKF